MNITIINLLLYIPYSDGCFYILIQKDMELKREMFFDGEEILYENIINTVTQHPQEMRKILTYVFDEMKKLWEYMGKKSEVDKHYHKEIHELKEEYHII